MVFQFKPVKIITIQFPQDKSTSLANYIVDEQLILDSSEGFLLLFSPCLYLVIPSNTASMQKFSCPYIQIEIYSKCYPWTFAVFLVKYSLKRATGYLSPPVAYDIAGRISRDVSDSPLFLVFVDLLQIRCIPNDCHVFQHSCVIFFVFTKTKILRN